MRLHEHPDFATFVTAAANAAELQESFVEKDYWITEILRVIAATLPERAMFKGGTSLSKGWGLLDRFSEDVDLFVNPSVHPPLSGNQIDKVLKGLRDDVDAIPGLMFDPEESRTIGGFGRMDTFRYEPAFEGPLGFPPTVRLEPGVQSGQHPTERRPISSLVGAMLVERGVAGGLQVEGLEPFDMELLHFRRTFCGKAVCNPRQDRAPQVGSTSPWPRRAALRRPLRACGPSRGRRHAGEPGVRADPRRLRREEPGVLPQELSPAR